MEHIPARCSANRVVEYIKTDSGFNLLFDSVPEVAVNDIFGLQFVDDAVDGFYKVASILLHNCKCGNNTTFTEERVDQEIVQQD